MLSALHVVVLAELLVAGKSAQLRSGRHAGAEQFFSFDYSKHGQDWVAGTCSSRARQSPIDLPAYAPVTGTFEYKYNPIAEPFELLNNGHGFSIDLAGLAYGGITYNKALYNLLNVNVHSLSEHAYAGMQMPLELHLVHKRYDNDQLLIVAIPVESPTLTGAAMQAAALREKASMGMPGFLQQNASQSDFWTLTKQMPGQGTGQVPTFTAQGVIQGSSYREPPAQEPGFNPALQAFLKMAPPPQNMKVNVPANPMSPYDLNTMMHGGTYYEYAGSLTAPPCAEIVTWLVRKESIKASDKQLMYLHDAVYKTTADFGNYRSMMPLNGRVVSMLAGVLDQPPVGPPPPAGMPPPVSDREYRAMKWAMDAMTIAKSATDYVKDLDNRLRNAAQAHASALAPKLAPLKVRGQVEVEGNAIGAFGPLAQPMQQPLQMEKTAETVARALAMNAREEVQDASQEIATMSKEVAMEAARQAAGLVYNGGERNMASLAKSAGNANPPVKISLASLGKSAGNTGSVLAVGLTTR